MKKILYLFLFFYTANLIAQTPWDAILMEKKELCIAVIYDEAGFSKYYQGDVLIENLNLGTFKRRSIMAMAAYGITDRIDVIAMAPYISTSSTGGQLAGVSGIQDLSLAVKGRFLEVENDGGRFSLLGLVGFSTPLTNYISDYMPYSIGLGSTEVNLRATAEYAMNSGLYGRASFAYHFRGYSEIEREFYYNNGAVYSNYMNVPNAYNLHAAIGFLTLEGRLRLEATYTGIKCVSGDDIRTWNRPQPTNKMMFDQVGVFAQYYFKKLNQLSLVGYSNTVVAGRNMGKFTNYSLGVTYQFGL